MRCWCLNVSHFILDPLARVWKGSGNREAQRREGPRGGACSSLGSRGQPWARPLLRPRGLWALVV